MAVNTIYDVTYDIGNKELQRDLVLASAGDAATIGAVISGNASVFDKHRSGTVTIRSIRNFAANVLS